MIARTELICFLSQTLPAGAADTEHLTKLASCKNSALVLDHQRAPLPLPYLRFIVNTCAGANHAETLASAPALLHAIVGVAQGIADGHELTFEYLLAGDRSWKRWSEGDVPWHLEHGKAGTCMLENALHWEVG